MPAAWTPLLCWRLLTPPAASLCFSLSCRLEVEGTGFLYKQVRHMTGALLAVGTGQLAPDAISAALAAGERVRTGAERDAYRGWMVAEAKGLCLQQVVYAPCSSLGAAQRPSGAAASWLW